MPRAAHLRSACLLAAALAATGCAALRDPVTHDPARLDPAFPAALVETAFVVEGARLNTIVYQAQGEGPHPTVVLLHGMPGNERNLDLAQALRRAGWNVVFFHYRGAWGSGGTFSFGNVLDDVAAVVGIVTAPEWAAAHRVDPARVALVGHSMGGFAALRAGADLAAVECIASLAGANFGGFAAALGDAETRAGFEAALDRWSGPLRTRGGAALVDEIATRPERFDTLRQAPALASKHLLLLAGSADADTPPVQHHDPLVAALRAAGASDLETEVFEGADHSFSAHRVAISRRVASWLQRRCVE